VFLSTCYLYFLASRIDYFIHVFISISETLRSRVYRARYGPLKQRIASNRGYLLYKRSSRARCLEKVEDGLIFSARPYRAWICKRARNTLLGWTSECPYS